MTPILSAKDLSFSYEGTPLFQNLSCALFPKTLTTLIGPNGAGKTTLLRLLSGILAPHQGEIFLNAHGQDKQIQSVHPKIRAQHIAMVEQNTTPSFDFTVYELVTMGRYPHLKKNIPIQEHRSIIQLSLEQTGLQNLAQKRYSALSSGERQRALIALALSQKPSILILDEPLSFLDPRYQAEIFELLLNLKNQGLSIMITLHQLHWAHGADQVFLLSQTTHFRQGCPKEILSPPLLSTAFQVNADSILLNRLI